MSDGRYGMGSDGRAGAASSTSIAVPASTAELSSLRHRVGAFARHTGGDDTVAGGTFVSSPLVCQYEFRLIRGIPAVVPARKRSFCSPVNLSMSSLRNVA